MGNPDDFEAYQKGYEDAMHAAGSAGSTSASATAKPSTKAKASTNGSDIGGKAARGIGFAIGWLIVFPFGMALMAYCIGWVLGGSEIAEGLALFFGLICFGFALFAGVVLVGFQLFVRLWPIIIPAVIILIVVKKMT